MSDHTSALVPVESWTYMSPQLRHSGKAIDFGLLCEALIYYDRVLVVSPNRWEFSQFIAWFVEQGRYGDLIALLKNNVINVYYYSFFSAAVEKDGGFSIWNLEEKRAAAEPTFEADCLSPYNLRQVLPHAGQRSKLYRAIRGRVIEAKSEDFGPAIENARRDYHDPERCALLIQALFDEVYPILGLKEPPTVSAKVIEDAGKVHIGWNVDFERVNQALGADLGFTPGYPLSAAARCNRLLWSAAKLGCDLYLGSPMSLLVGDKLYESGQRLARPQEFVEQLEAEVEFPNVRELVNSQQIGLAEVLELRRKGGRFRRWLQDESERDRNAIIAYHNEAAKESGWIKAGRRGLKLFGVLGGAAANVVVKQYVPGAEGVLAAAAAGAGIKYVTDLASKINENWRPVVFGNWASSRIKKWLSKQRDN
jgi:hypothetical protein